jgi:hypothetical protein
MAGWWFEAYTLPHAQVGAIQKVAEQLPVQDWSFEENTDRARSTIKFGVPRAHPFFDIDEIFKVDPEDHSNDVGSIVVAYNQEHLDGSNVPLPIQAYFIARRPDQTANVQESIVDLSGRHLLTALDHFYVYPFDYPLDPSQVMDWQYGAGSILTNPGFEDGNPQSERWYVWIEGATTGTFALRSGAEVTGPIPWDATATDIKNAIETGFAWVISCSVSGQGTEESPFIITINDPSGEDMFDLFLDSDTTDGTVEVGVDLQGGGLDISGWTRSVNISTQSSEYGRYASDGFRLSQAGEPVRTGDYSLRINGLDIYTGAMQAIDVVPGQRYRGSIWVYTSSTTDVFRLIIRTVWDEFIASSHGLSGVAVPANTWTEFSVDFVVPDFITTVVFRFAVVGVNGNPGEQGNPSPFYLDDASFSPGAPPSNMGVIWGDLMDDIQIDHSADTRGAFGTWINRTWDDTNDSNGLPWTQEHSVTIREGQTYLQFAEEMADRFGYKFDMWLDPDDMEIYMGIFQAGGEDFSADDSLSLVIGKDIVSGELVKSEATATDVFARGADGLFAESGDATLRTAWDRREKLIRDPNLTAVEDLTLAAQEELSKLIDAMLGMKFEMMDIADGDTKPFVHFRTWDQINVEPGSDSGIGKASRTVQSIKVDGNGGSASSISLHLSSEVFGSSGFAAQAEAVRRLVRKFLFHMPHPQEGGTTLGRAGGGGIPDVVVAAYDTLFIESADLLSKDYPSDDVMLQVAMSMLPEEGGWIHLLEGTYEFSGRLIFASNVKLTGAGEGSTLIYISDGVAIGDELIRVVAGVCSIEDLNIDGNKVNGSSATALVQMARAQTARLHMRNVTVENGSGMGIFADRPAGAIIFESVRVRGHTGVGAQLDEVSCMADAGTTFSNNGDSGVEIQIGNGNWLQFNGTRFTDNGGAGITNGGLLGGGAVTVDSCWIEGNTGDGVQGNGGGGDLDIAIITNNIILDNGAVSAIGDATHSVIADNYIAGNGTDIPTPDHGNVIGGVGGNGTDLSRRGHRDSRRRPLLLRRDCHGRVGDVPVLLPPVGHRRRGAGGGRHRPHRGRA